MDKKVSSHHVIPSSRSKFGKEVTIPDKFHKAWHALFGNLCSREVELFIEAINDMMDTQDEITSREIARLREEIKGMNLYEFQKTKEDSAGKRRRR